MAILMLVMGVLSPYWIKAIDPAMAPLAASANAVQVRVHTPTPTAAAAVVLEKQ
jgi:hypothetical protein